MILHYSLAIWKINDNALSLIFFVNAQRSGLVVVRLVFWIFDWMTVNVMALFLKYIIICNYTIIGTSIQNL